MKKVYLMMLVMLGLFVLIGCKEEVIYSVDSKFLYSDNGRSAHEEGVQEF